MNIFATSDCPVRSANYLDDKRVVKMVLESAQLLSTAMTLTGGTGPYRVTHQNHPCAVWARSSRARYLWLLDHFAALCDEYEARYNKLHACEKWAQVFRDYADEIIVGDGDLLAFKNCTPYKDFPVHDAYRLVLADKWASDVRPATRYGNPL